MYYTGVDPRTMENVYVPKNPHEKAMQRALIQYRNPELYRLVEEALKKAGRTDLIGCGPKCLIRPKSAGKSVNTNKKTGSSAGNAGRKKKTAKKKTIRNIHKKK